MFFFTKTTFLVCYRKHFFPGEFNGNEPNQPITVKAKDVAAAHKKVGSTVGPVNINSMKASHAK